MNVTTLATAEARVLLDSVRAFAAERGEAAGDFHSSGRIASADLDWDRVLQLAEQHGVTALLHRHVEARMRTEVPATARTALRESYTARIGRHLHMACELLELLAALSARGVRAVPFEGPVMAADLYGNVALRDVRDLDLFIGKHDLLKAKAILIARGFESAQRLSQRSETTPEHDSAYAFRDDRGLQVRLHWAQVQPYVESPAADGCWERLGSTMLCGIEVPSFAPEDQLLASCANGAQHCWERLVWVADVARILQVHPELDWDVVFHRARALRGGRILSLGLWLAHQQLAAELPPHVHRLIAGDAALPRLAQRVMDGMFGPTERSWTPARKNRFHLHCRDRVIDRLRYLALRLLASRRRRPARA